MASRIKEPVEALNGSNGGPRKSKISRGDFVTVTTLDRTREQLRDQLFPAEVQNILRLALNGSPIFQQRLYEKMLDTWWRMQKNVNELCDAVCGIEWKVNPFVVQGQKATDSAQEKADLVTRAINGFHPDITRHERDFKGLLRDLTHSRILGHMVSEIRWEQRGGETMPQCTVALPARYYGYPIGVNEPDRLMLNQSGSLSNAIANLEDFSKHPNRFVVGICQRSTAHPTVSAMFRCLSAWWLASVFGLEWLMHYAELFGIPWRIGKYKRGEVDAKTALLTFMRDLGSGGWGVFPDNCEVEIHESTKGAAGDLPQKLIQDMADKACDILILGQTLTSDVSSTGAGGNRALGQVHQDIRDEVLTATVNYVSGLLNTQFVPALLRLNYGDEVDEMPSLDGNIDQPQDELQLAQRDKILFVDMKLPVSVDYLRKHNNVPVPSDDDEMYDAPPPTSSGGMPVSAAHVDPRAGRRPNLEHLLDNVLENLTNVSSEWLAPVRPIFRDLILMAQKQEVTDADLIQAIESAAKRMPNLFDELKTEVLETELRNAMGSALINGVTDRLSLNHSVVESAEHVNHYLIECEGSDDEPRDEHGEWTSGEALETPLHVDVNSAKPYFAKIKGLSAKYGFNVDFLPETKRVSKGYRTYAITHSGIYKHAPKEAIIGNSRRDTGYVKVDPGGKISEISKEEAATHFSPAT